MSHDFRANPPASTLKRENHPAYYDRAPLRVVPEDECRLHEGNQVEDCQGCIANGEREWENREMRSVW